VWSIQKRVVFKATHDQGQAIHLLSEGAKQLLRVAEGRGHQSAPRTGLRASVQAELATKRE
jgi:hypothetical protein